MIPVSVVERFRTYPNRHIDSMRIYVLVDGIQYQQQTGQQLETLDGVAVSLFAGTRDIALAHAGPWLVATKEAHGKLADFGDLEAACPGVVWLFSRAGLESLADKLRPHLSVRLSNSRSAMLRFWDPRVLHELNQTLQSKQERALFKAAPEWLYLDEGQRQIINDDTSTI
ncbi:DUF4123 domain-containing protein [Burkholderia vietnamiensis]|uniref:DUF4123 domain-containing protein n=1 Tax=Burkholderia vietnamiensis TaxID=60552 RepID=UPI001594AE1E|nr:DUF4123 domain-containing protein [Burkholderia vietnamiensis]MBR8152560.1 DUF4123 domain-containing protein [Burkholderia vietnamiensis]MDN7665636.1 DUF4123 domain-containing protein [Burkholderia vietnamiensis]HDR9025060.1 DUF4123 domain-containing protein [Burkholderia vietnamiensis]HDR9077075.1 DUF4123 domain-containing protein [Burkholderia vietnamiensis]HDR9202784.1 DUF4123 domain-containing protein [Burkholderia vietnamiensis]